jgi:hypothetical protein
MVANNQLSLQFDIIVPLGKGKRVHYKVPTYTKTYTNDIHQDGTIKDDSVWTQIHQTYKALANYCPFPMFEEQKESYDFEGVRIWTDVYTRGRYEYYGQTFEGQEFSERFAEIIGTERLGVEERLKVHTELLAFLRNGMNMQEAVNKCLMNKI